MSNVSRIRDGSSNGGSIAGGEPRTSSGTRTKLVAPVELVVDDVEDNIDLFASVLRREDFVVATARDGIEALAVAEAERPAVVITDLAMPIMDGFELVRRLREEEHGARMHVIVVSAFADPASRRAAAEAGADEYLAKPCTPAALVERVRAALEARRQAVVADDDLPITA
jgi:CheY-like chemotaxis protein